MRQRLHIKQVEGTTGNPASDNDIYAKYKVSKLPTEDWRDYYQKYVLQFGKYKGVQVTTMVSAAEISWLLWYYNTVTEKESSLSKKANITYRVVKWYLNARKLLPKKVPNDGVKIKNGIVTVIKDGVKSECKKEDYLEKIKNR